MIIVVVKIDLGLLERMLEFSTADNYIYEN